MKHNIYLFVSCVLALLPFWFEPLAPGHDLSFQWQAGVDFAKHGTFYHQAKPWPTELSGQPDIDGSYDKKWLTAWPPALSCMVAIGVLLGQPVFWVKFFFSVLFLAGWGGWLKVAPKEILGVFSFLPLFLFVKEMGMFTILSPLMTDWMVFLVFPFWVLAMRRFAETLESKTIFWICLTSLSMIYIKYSTVYVFLASIALIFYFSRKANGFKNGTLFVVGIAIGLLPLFFFLKHGSDGSVRPEVSAFKNFPLLASKNLGAATQDFIVYGFYDLLRASGLGSVAYMGGAHLPIFHRLGRLVFLASVIYFPVIYLKKMKFQGKTITLDDNSVIQFAVIGSAFLFLLFMSLLSGVQITTVSGHWSYLRDYRYLLPITPFLFIIFWKNALSCDRRFKYLLRAMVAVVAIYGFFHMAFSLAAAAKEGGIFDQSMSLYSKSDYAVHRAMFEAKGWVKKQYPGLGVVCFRYEIDRGFDRVGIIYGCELRKEMSGYPFAVKNRLAVVIAVPTENNPYKNVAPTIDLSKYQKIEASDYQGPNHFYYQIVEPGTFEL